MARTIRRRIAWTVPFLLLAAGAALLWVRRYGRDPVEAARESASTAAWEQGPESSAALDAMDRLVEALYGAGRAAEPETEEAARKVVEIRRRTQGKLDPVLAGSLDNLGAVLHARGAFGEARSVLEEALEIRRHHQDEPLQLFATVNNLAWLDRESGDLPAARTLFDEALAVIDRLSPEEARACAAAAWHNYGIVLHDMGDLAEARKLLERTRDHWDGRDDAELSSALNSLGRLLHDAGDLGAARLCLERAASIHRRAPSRDPVRQAAVINNLGFLLHDAGDLDGALPLYEKAIELRRRHLGRAHPDLAWTLDNLGLLRMERGETGPAGRLFSEALSVREAALGKDHPLVAHSLSYVAALRIAEGAPAAALSLALRAEETRRTGLLLATQLVEERRALLLRALDVFGLDATGLDLAITSVVRGRLPPDAVASVWDAAIRARGLVLDELAERRRLAAVSPELRAPWQQLVAARERLSALWVRGASPEVIDAARREKEAAEVTLAARSRAFDDVGRRSQKGWDDVRRALLLEPQGTVLVAFQAYRDWAGPRGGKLEAARSYAAFVMPRDADGPSVVPLGREDDLGAIVGAWRSSLLAGAGGNPESECLRSGAELRRRLWDDVLRGIERRDRILIVPDGIINEVSFAALPGASAPYLVEEAPLIHHLSTEKDLIPGDDTERRRGSGALVIGRPAFGASPEIAPDARCLEALRFEDLPGTEAEARAIRDILRDAPTTTGEAGTPPLEIALLVGTEADESRFKALAPGRRILHLATHGFCLDEDCRSRDAGPEVGGRGLSVAVASTVRRSRDAGPANPLLLSGLALAGANERERLSPPADGPDGILTAEEIAALDLGGVELAVLSACSTALGEVVRGEGVLGLRRAFRAAGVSVLVMSLWPVEDESTRDWMGALYRARFVRSLDMAQSVREASRSVLAERRAGGRPTHPFFWAGFVAAGR